jgi:hypothetical protein
MERDLMADVAVDTSLNGPLSRRLAFVRWLRRMHGWIGLWGAILGLLFGTSGVWLNHRAQLKIEPAHQQINGQLALPGARPADAQAMAEWLRTSLKFDRPANSIRVDRARPVPWAESGAAEKPMQPERWSFVFGGPDRVIQAEYWVGNGSISLRTTNNGFFATLTNLHKGVNMPVPWVLLVDTLAGSLIFLSLTGAILWWESNRRRRLGLGILVVSVALTIGLALWPLQP